MLKRLIEQLCSDLELPLNESEDGSFFLDFEPNLHITLREIPNSGIRMNTVLAPVPKEKAEEFFLKAMSANLLGRETGGGVLGLDKDGKRVTFTCFLQSEISFRDLHDVLEDFTNYAEAWRQETIDFK